MSRLERLLALVTALTAVAGSAGWVKLDTSEGHRQVAIRALAEALAECERRP